MAQRDLYEVLGVDRSANEDDLKKAYRRLAKKLHPDQNRGDAQAAERFKEINAAYDILKDGQKRAAYDRFGHAAFNGSASGRAGPFAGPDIGDAFADMFGDIFGEFMGGRAGAQRGAAGRGGDEGFEIAVDLADAFEGKKVKMRVPTLVACNACGATGSASRSAPSACRTCGGRGRVRTQQGFMMMERTCPTCRGQGESIRDPCRACGGSGRRDGSHEVEVRIPPGIEDGNRLRLTGKGEAGMRGGASGDLYLTVRVRKDDEYDRNGADLRSHLSVPFTTAALGGAVRARTIDGRGAEVRIPAGTETGEWVKLRGRGMPALNGSGRGDHYVSVHVATPKDLTRKQKRLLEEFAAEEERRARR